MIPLLGVVSGILLSKYTGAPLFVSLLLILSALLIYYSFLRIGKGVVAAFKFRNAHYIWVYLLFVGLGSFVFSLNRPEPFPDDNLYSGVTVSGRVTDIKTVATGDVVTLKVYSVRKGSTTHDVSNVSVLLKNSHIPVSIDDVILVSTELSPLKDSPNSFETGYAQSMADKGVLYEGRMFGLSVIGKRPTVSGIALHIRSRLEVAIEKSGLSKAMQNFLITVLLGDRNYLDPHLRRQFADAGVAHVLALSGMHTAIIGGILLFVLFPLNFAGRYRLRLLLAALLLWFYAFISGMSPATVRACIMLSFATIAILLERRRAPFNALCGAALLILVFTPAALVDIGFQLSFLCVFSLLAFARPLNFIDHLHHPRLYKATTLLLATLAATFGSWVLTGYYFNSIPMGFLPANLLILPLLPCYMVLSIIHIGVSSVGGDIPFLGQSLDAIFNLLTKFTSLFSRHGMSLGVDIPVQSVIMWGVGMILLAIYLNVKRHKTFLYPAILSFVLAILFIPFLESEVPDGSFILRNDYREIKITTRINKTENVLMLPRYANSSLRIDDKMIMAIDKPLDYKEIPPQCDYMLIAGGFKGDIIELLSICKPEKLVVHTSVRRKTEREYRQICDSLSIPFHSLRNDAPLRHINK